jgi:hypothetical protein
LPDGCKPQSQFGYIVGLGMVNVGLFNGQLEHLWLFGMFYSHLVYIVVIWSKSYDRELQRQRCKNLQRC